MRRLPSRLPRGGSLGVHAGTRERGSVASTLPRSEDVQRTRKKRRARGRVQLPEVSVEDLSSCRSRTFQNENTTFQRGMKEQRMAEVSNKATSCDQIYLTIRFTCVLWEKRIEIENETMEMYTGTEYSTEEGKTK